MTAHMMFWRFSGYANASAIDTLLEKTDCTLEELLEEPDLIQELKQHNAKLVEYLRDEKILEKMLDYAVAPMPVSSGEDEDSKGLDSENPDDKGKETSLSKLAGDSPKTKEEEYEEATRKWTKYSYNSAEVLSSETWSLTEAIMEREDLLRKFWDFLKQPIPLNTLQAGYFTKVNEQLLDKKTEQMLNFFKSIDDIVPNMLSHVDSPMVMDLLLKIISMEKTEGGEGIVDWLASQNLMPILLGYLSPKHSWATQTSAGDFLKAIITISANASQNEQSCIGPNELTRQLVSSPCIENLISDMLQGGNPLTVGVGIVIEVIRKNNSDYDPEVGSEANAIPSSRDPIYLGTLLRMFAKHVPDFMALILSPNHTVSAVSVERGELDAAFGSKIEPLGFDRFKTCELMAELLHCSNMGLLNEPGSEEFVQARNLERDRLRAEGKLNGGSREDHPDSINEDLTINSLDHSRFETDSPDDMRKIEEDMQALQAQNSTDDDGFEQVSRDLGDEVKDDFDEVISTPTKPDMSLSFLDKDDEEFVDEPLSSPRLQQAELNPDGMVHPEDIPAPLSPAKGTIAEPSRKQSETVDGEARTGDAGLAADEESASETAFAPEVNDSVVEEANRPKTPDTAGPKLSLDPSATGLPASPSSADGGDFSPHPEDQPAPLFLKKAEPSPPLPERPTSDAGDNHEPNGSREDADTTMAEASGSQSFDGTNELSKVDANQTIPVVGDFLKKQFVEHKVVPTILDFFFRFPWNNFLHNVVYDVVQQVFNGPMDRGFRQTVGDRGYNRRLAMDLFETGNITARIVEGQKKSDESQARNRMRLGYMGHLTLIAEEVVKFTERHPPGTLSESVLVDKVMNDEWVSYVEVTLAETRERDNAILGGVRPDMSAGPRQAVMNAVNAASGFGGGNSSALADAGLNGSVGLDSIDLGNGNGANGGSFTLTGGSALSGFGSSSDEEEDEMDDDLEEEGKLSSGGAEFSRYITTSSTTTATSQPGSELEPPSAPPPPPPPLNIPPSRARRQLAARLALHKQNTGSNSENASSDDLDKQERSERRENLNPFATDEDDDDDTGDDQDEFTIGDLEAEEEGRGILPPGSPMAGKAIPVRALDNSSDEDSDSDDGFGHSLGDDESGSPRKERRPSTTEALRRTSLEDDDEGDEVVHVMVEDDSEKDSTVCPITLESSEEGKESLSEQTGSTDEPKDKDDEELVEIQHTEGSAGGA